MKRYRFEIELSNGSRIDAASVAETEEEALDRVLGDSRAVAFMNGSAVAGHKTVGTEEVVCPPFNRFVFRELEDEPGFFEVRDREGMFAVKWHDGGLQHDPHDHPVERERPVRLRGGKVYARVRGVDTGLLPGFRMTSRRGSGRLPIRSARRQKGNTVKCDVPLFYIFT